MKGIDISHNRTKSIQDMPRSGLEKVRQSRRVSFRKVTNMVDAVLRLSSNTGSEPQVKQQVDAAMENDNIEEIRKLLSSGSTDLQTVLVSALEKVSVSHFSHQNIIMLVMPPVFPSRTRRGC